MTSNLYTKTCLLWPYCVTAHAHCAQKTPCACVVTQCSRSEQSRSALNDMRSVCMAFRVGHFAEFQAKVCVFRELNRLKWPETEKERHVSKVRRCVQRNSKVWRNFRWSTSTGHSRDSSELPFRRCEPHLWGLDREMGEIRDKQNWNHSRGLKIETSDKMSRRSQI